MDQTYTVVDRVESATLDAVDKEKLAELEGMDGHVVRERSRD